MKRDLSICKETYPFEKRPILVIRDVSKRTSWRLGKGVPYSLVIPWALPSSVDTLKYVKRDVFIYKEIYAHEKRPIHIKKDLSKRPIALLGKRVYENKYTSTAPAIC